MNDTPPHSTEKTDDANNVTYRIAVSKLDTRVLYRITAIAFRHYWRMTIAIVATVIASIFQLYIPWYLGQAVDHAQGLLAKAAAGNGAEIETEEALFITAMSLLTAAIGRGLFTMIQNYQGEAVGQLIAYHLRIKYYRKLQQLSFSWHDRVHSGDLMTRGILDIEGVRRWIDTGFLRMILLTCLIGGGAVILLRNDTSLGLMALSFVPIVALRSSLARIKLRDTWLGLQDQMSHLTKVMEENLGGIRVVRAFAAQAYEMARFDESANKALAIAVQRVRLFVHSTTQMTFVYYLAMAATLWIGGEKALNGTITLGQLTETLTFMLILRMPVRQIGWMINSIARASTCGGRLFSVLDLVPSISNKPDAKPINLTSGIVRFDAVDFRYPSLAKDKWTLKGVSFEARPGRMIGIVGPPGAGKTTIAHLLGRYYDVTKGRITIDGQDIRNVSLKSLRNTVSIVQQEPFLFTASLNHNVAYGAPWASKINIERSSQTAQLHNYFRALPNAYNTLVGERGVSLSGGQRQRLSIARAILPDARVLVLDDSTAAVDAATELRIRNALKDFIAGRAVIIIAHRLTSLMHADEILFLEEGQVVERGNHDELMAEDTRYRRLYELQARSGKGSEA